ncbi:pyrimidine-nucleoside phosphorylase [soil metagenome]
MTEPGLNVVALIERKKRGEALSEVELEQLSGGYLRGEIPDYQMAAWLMAVCWRGMTEAETLCFTRALVASGAELNWDHLGRPAVDKHSTGGVGDKTSLVLVPLMAAAGLPFVKMSGRGLGHTGGTLDKLESIAGFSVNLSLDDLRSQVAKIGCALVGQSPELVPADGALYALRDVTGTVNALPLIAASIMSKKLAGGAGIIVLDVKYGSGAFLPALEDARRLAAAMVAIGTGAGRKVRAVLSSMEQPLGRAVGNSLEVREVIQTLQGDGPADLWDLTLELGSHLLMMSGEARDGASARKRLGELRDTGAAAAKLEELISAQGGDHRVVRDPDRLPSAPHVRTVDSPESGWVAGLNARAVGEAGLELGAGRRRKSDTLDLSAGVRLLARTGDRVEQGQPLAELHASTLQRVEQAERTIRSAYIISPTCPSHQETSYQVIGSGQGT